MSHRTVSVQGGWAPPSPPPATSQTHVHWLDAYSGDDFHGVASRGGEGREGRYIGYVYILPGNLYTGNVYLGYVYILCVMYMCIFVGMCTLGVYIGYVYIGCVYIGCVYTLCVYM